MKKILFYTLLGLGIILGVYVFAQASDKATIAVSCSIPAVPGLNAPPLPTTTQVKEINAGSQTDPAKTQETPQPGEKEIQENRENQIALAQGRITQEIVKTIYTR
jgi:hypothetical protein